VSRERWDSEQRLLDLEARGATPSRYSNTMVQCCSGSPNC
jgi:hypothetical protein